MEGNDRKRFDEMMLELEASPEQVLIQAIQTFDGTHSDFLESAVLFARNKTNPVSRTLMDASNGRLVSDFRSCYDVLEQVEESLTERTGLLGWLLTHEQHKRAGFMNFYTNHTDMTFHPIGEDEAHRAAANLVQTADARTAIHQFWQKSLYTDVIAFVQKYRD